MNLSLQTPSESTEASPPLQHHNISTSNQEYTLVTATTQLSIITNKIQFQN